MVVEPHEQSWGAVYSFPCPGCKSNHAFHVRIDGGHPSWTFDGDIDRPTVSPSILVTGGESDMRCHTFIKAGKIEFLSDCSHSLAGTTVVMEPIDG
jgi:hypothetical protein